MKCILFANEAYVPMVNEYVLPTLGAFEVKWVKPLVQEEVTWDTPRFRGICKGKPAMLLRHMEVFPKDEVFLYVDGDVEFFGVTPQLLLEHLGDGDFATHAEFPNHVQACTGIIVIRNTDLAKDMVDKWVKEFFWEDEVSFNRVMDAHPEFKSKHRWLPNHQFCNLSQLGIGYDSWEDKIRKVPTMLPRTIRSFHANFAVGLKPKSQLLEVVRQEVRSWNR